MTNLTVLLTVTLLVLAGLLIRALLQRRRLNHRAATLERLLELADRLEADLKSCRTGLAQAHAVIGADPDLPAQDAQDADRAVDAGLRALLQQRIWIRDRALQASPPELDAVYAAMQGSHDRLQPLLQALRRARHDLDEAMREHLRHDVGKRP